MATLKNSTGTVLGHKVLNAKKMKDPIKIENRLLDGSFHFQIIGDTPSVIEVEVIASGYHKDLIDGYEAMVADVRIEFDGKYYVGPIRTTPTWNLLKPGTSSADRLYVGTFTMVVSGEGGTA